MKHAVIYHHPCMDGYAAACAFKSAWIGDDVSYHQANYSYLDQLPARAIDTDTTHVFFLDICPNAEVIAKMLADYPDVVFIILDHHATAKDVLTSLPHNPKLRFMLAETVLSGATLTYTLRGQLRNIAYIRDDGIKPAGMEQVVSGLTSHLDPTSVERKLVYLYTNIPHCSFIWTDGMPDIWRLIGIRDLWVTDDPNAKANADWLSSYLRFKGLMFHPVADLEAWVKNEGGISKIVESGVLIDAIHRKLVNDSLKTALNKVYKMPDGILVDTIIGSTPHDLGSLYGELGYSRVSNPAIVVGVSTNFNHGVYGISLRSNGIECRSLAAKFGGGGHNLAAGGSYATQQSSNGDLIEIAAVVHEHMLSIGGVLVIEDADLA